MTSRTFKFKSPEQSGDVVVTVNVVEHDSGEITVTIYDPKSLVSYVDHLAGQEWKRSHANH